MHAYRKDTIDLDEKTLLPVKSSAQGMGTMSLTYATDAISGEMGSGGQTMNVKTALKAPVAPDGAGLEVAIATLPLAEGYTATLRFFEPLSQKVRLMNLKVTGKETTTVAAGSFETFVVQLEPLDGEASGQSTLHLLQKSPHHVVRSQTKLPAMMGGGSMTIELAVEGAGDVGSRP